MDFPEGEAKTECKVGNTVINIFGINISLNCLCENSTQSIPSYENITACECNQKIQFFITVSNFFLFFIFVSFLFCNKCYFKLLVIQGGSQWMVDLKELIRWYYILHIHFL